MASGAKRQARHNVVSAYFAEIRNFPLLTREEEKSLARDIQEGSQTAINTLVESNLGFVAKVASEYRSCGLPFEDLLNEGNLGLLEAARRFDPERDAKFISYAIWWIRKTIRKALTEHGHVVRTPYSYQKKVKEISRTQTALRRSLGREPSREEIAHELDVSIERIDRVQRTGAREMSIDESMGDDSETSFASQLEDEAWVSPESKLLDDELSEGVFLAYGELNDQQRVVIAHRFGLAGEPPLTLQETGKRIGLSRERVRQIENQALARMRKTLAKRSSVDAPSKPPRPSVDLPARGVDSRILGRSAAARVRVRPEPTVSL